MAAQSKIKYQNEFLERFLASRHFKEVRQHFSHSLGNPIWWVVSRDQNFYSIDTKLSNHQCAGPVQCLATIRAVKRDAKKMFTEFNPDKEDQLFFCTHNYRGFCLPIGYEEKIFGYLIVCHVSNPLTEDLVKILKLSIDFAVYGIHRDIELGKLYDTVRPRAIALSTIHTVHRLISSILKLDELMPRIARLVLQVLRADYCSIYLVDETNSRLTPKTVIDLGRKKAVKLKSKKMGVGIEGKVSATGNAVLKPCLLCVPLLHEDIIGVITVKRKNNTTRFSTFDKEILWTLAEQAVIAIKNAQLYEAQESLAVGSIRSLAALLNLKSPATYTHTQSFVKLALEIGKRMGMTQEELQYLHYAALLPDTGKAMVPESILTKPSGLTKDEYTLIKKHPLAGVEIIKHIDVLKPSIPMVLHHHERFDGKGYPDRLKGRNIPLGARILAVCDAFEAMVTIRPYRTVRNVAEAIEEICKHAGNQFDPEIVDIIHKLFQQGFIDEIVEGFGRREK